MTLDQLKMDEIKPEDIFPEVNSTTTGVIMPIIVKLDSILQ